MIIECFRNKKFRALWSAGCMTGIARAMEFLALSLFILEDIGIAFLITIIFAIRMSPMSLLGIFIGSISEKLRASNIVKFLYVCSTTISLICFILAINNIFNIYFAFIFAFINGTTWVVDLAVRRRIIIENIEEKFLSTSLAMETLSNNATRLIGPLLTGLLYIAIDLQGLFLILFILYLNALILIIFFQRNSEEDQINHSNKLAFYSELVNSLDNIKKTIIHGFKETKLRLLLIVTLIFNIFGFPLISLVPVYGKNNLSLNEFDIGVLTSSEGLGALIGSLIIAKMSPQKKLSILFLTGCIGFFVGMIAFSISPNLFSAFVCLTFGGIFLSGFSTMQGALTYRSANKGSRGHNFGILVTCIGLAPLGLIYLSFLIVSFPVENLIQINSCIALTLLISIGYLIYKKYFITF